MGVALIDGFRMHLTCLASINDSNLISFVDMKWSGLGMKSLWVNQSDIKKHDNTIKRELFFEPWLDLHAGEYTCHVLVELNDNNFTWNKTFLVDSKYYRVITVKYKT